MGDAELAHLDTLLRYPLVGFLDQSLLTSKRRPHATLMVNKE
jgi:hypothetical protein